MKVLLGMSGGLDSTYAAKKLLNEGFVVEGAVLDMHEYTEVDSARASAQALGITLHVIDCRDIFLEKVKKPFADEYSLGRTPNPCIVCNPEVKFCALARFAKEYGFDKIATGHYATIHRKKLVGAEHYFIGRAIDKAKDQSYMLYRLPQDILQMLILPMGTEVKTDVREKIKGTEMADFDRPDSQEICFLPNGNYVDYVESLKGKSAVGHFVDEDGNLLGEHKGIIHYTVGQRRGLGISLGERVFVRSIDPKRNTVTLGKEPIYNKEIIVKDLILSPAAFIDSDTELNAEVKVRYLAPFVSAQIAIIDRGRARVTLSEPAKSVTPGQSCVFYLGELVIGGGVIDSAL